MNLDELDRFVGHDFTEQGLIRAVTDIGDRLILASDLDFHDVDELNVAVNAIRGLMSSQR